MSLEYVPVIWNRQKKIYDLVILGLSALYLLLFAAFPDIQYTVEALLAEGDKVVVRWTARGTHTGELMGIPPTGKQVTVTGVNIGRVANGRIVEEWGEFDMMGMMQQLGVVPTPGG